jgi:hypothetical protein
MPLYAPIDIEHIEDVVITTPADNEVLAYDNASETWINQTQVEAGLYTTVDFTIDFAAEDLANLNTKSHTALTDIGTNTHAQIDTHIADTSDPHGASMLISTQLSVPKIVQSGTITLDAFSAGASSVVITNSSAGDASLTVDDTITCKDLHLTVDHTNAAIVFDIDHATSKTVTLATTVPPLAAITISLPNATCTLPGLSLGNTFTATNAFTANTSLQVANIIVHDGDADTHISFTTDNIDITAGNIKMLTFKEAAPIFELVVNEDSVNMDFRVETDNNANTLVVSGGTDTVTIGGNVNSGRFNVVQTDAAWRKPVMTLNQGDVDDSFINYIGTSQVDSSGSISSSTATAGNKVGAFKIEINGTARWVRVYDSAV